MTIEEKLRNELHSLTPEHRISRSSISDEALVALATCPADDQPVDLKPMTVVPHHGVALKREHARIGWDALNKGEVAVCYLSGGAGSRLGRGNKGLVRLPDLGMSLLAIKISQSTVSGWGRTFSPPTWIMTSPEAKGEVDAHLMGLAYAHSGAIKTFEQFEGYALTPMYELVRDQAGAPIHRPTGSGDLVQCLRESKFFHDFVAMGGKYVAVFNVDNIAGSLDPVLLGYHIASERALTCEVVRRKPGERGGGPTWVDGRSQVVEDFRLPEDTNPDECPLINTNNIIINADVLLSTPPSAFTYHRVQKTHESNIVIQWERLVHQLGEWHDMGFIEVPREHRFISVKTPDDLAAAARHVQWAAGEIAK